MTVSPGGTGSRGSMCESVMSAKVNGVPGAGAVAALPV